MTELTSLTLAQAREGLARRSLMPRKARPKSMVRISMTIKSVRRAVCAAQTASTTVKLLQMSTAVLVAPRPASMDLLAAALQ